MAPVQFWSTPGLYIKWAARNKPAIFWSIVVGSVGPVMAVVVPPIRARFGDGPRPQIPLTYPSKSRPLQPSLPYAWSCSIAPSTARLTDLLQYPRALAALRPATKTKRCRNSTAYPPLPPRAPSSQYMYICGAPRDFRYHVPSEKSLDGAFLAPEYWA